MFRHRFDKPLPGVGASIGIAIKKAKTMTDSVKKLIEAEIDQDHPSLRKNEPLIFARFVRRKAANRARFLRALIENGPDEEAQTQHLGSKGFNKPAWDVRIEAFADHIATRLEQLSKGEE